MLRRFDYGDWVRTGGLPVECWPSAALLELRVSIANALELHRLAGHALLVALDWADLVDEEIEARTKQKNHKGERDA